MIYLVHVKYCFFLFFHVLYDVLISYLETNLSMIQKPVNNESKESGSSKMAIHPQHSRQNLRSPIILSRQIGAIIYKTQFTESGQGSYSHHIPENYYRRNKFSPHALKTNKQFPQK